MEVILISRVNYVIRTGSDSKTFSKMFSPNDLISEKPTN